MRNDYRQQSEIQLNFMTGRGTVTEDQALGLRGEHEKIVGVMLKYHGDLDRIAKSGHLTKIGFTDENKRLAIKAHGELVAIVAKPFQAFSDQAAQAQAAMERKPATGGDALLAYLKEREARDGLAALDPAKVATMYLKGAETGDHDLCDAVEHAPSVRALVIPATLAAGKQIRLERQNPEAARLIGQLGAMRQSIDALFKSAVVELTDDAGGSLSQDVVAEMAAGGRK